MNTSRKFLLEVVCGNFESALAAASGGADRIELCTGLSEGGTTPSYGMIEQVRNHLKLKLHVLIRPRNGDFLYSDEEFSIMKKDINMCKNLKADGVVFGLLLSDGMIDTKRTKELVDLSKPMSVTFHRAFDVAKNPLTALEDVIACGCHRLLTSGQASSALSGASLIQKLISLAADRIVVMPGGGIIDQNIHELIRQTGGKEFHSSCKAEINSSMVFKNEKVSMGAPEKINEYSRIVTDPDKVRDLISNAKACLSQISP